MTQLRDDYRRVRPRGVPLMSQTRSRTAVATLDESCDKPDSAHEPHASLPVRRPTAACHYPPQQLCPSPPSWCSSRPRSTMPVLTHSLTLSLTHSLTHSPCRQRPTCPGASRTATSATHVTPPLRPQPLTPPSAGTRKQPKRRAWLTRVRTDDRWLAGGGAHGRQSAGLLAMALCVCGTAGRAGGWCDARYVNAGLCLCRRERLVRQHRCSSALGLLCAVWCEQGRRKSSCHLVSHDWLHPQPP
jgi:hypothetical protein